jgi:beta-glucosidase
MPRSLILLLLLISGLSTATAKQADAGKATLSEQQISKLVDSFFSRKTLADKLAEIQGVRPDDLLDENGKISLEKCRKVIPHGIGEVCQFTTSLKFTPEKSRQMVRESFRDQESPKAFHHEHR